MHKRKEDSDNCFKNARPREILEWKDILDQKFKSREVNIIITLGVEAELLAETTENPFCKKMQELLWARKFTAACDT